MDAVLETNFSLSYRNEVLNFLLPLFPPLEPKAPHVHAVTRLLVTLSDANLTVPMLAALVPKHKLLAYQLAFDLVEGGGQGCRTTRLARFGCGGVTSSTFVLCYSMRGRAHNTIATPQMDPYTVGVHARPHSAGPGYTPGMRSYVRNHALSHR